MTAQKVVSHLAAGVYNDGESIGKLGEAVYILMHDSTASIVSFGCRCV